MLEGEITRHLAAHWGSAALPSQAFILGLCLVTVGISTRCLISFNSVTSAKAAAVIFSFILAAIWAYWFVTAMTVSGLQYSELLWNQLGVIGLYLPQRLRKI